ncbi:MAG: NAD(P)H-hydrate dehydratase [Anaerolineae bacterium]|nr:NAD(P)H-hydrate dehydratase [Anaerolineae bacterium]
MKVSRVSEMRELDRRATVEFGIAAELLMENAGHAVYHALRDEFGVAGRRLVIFCGMGNNGGDGLVVARKAHSSGGTVTVFVLGDPDRFKGAAKTNFDVVSRLPIAVQRLETAAAAAAAVARCDVIVDAILGTGLTGEVTGLYRKVIELINGSGKPVLSVDIPSGVHGDTGQVMGAAVKADVTVTFGLPKIGNVLFPGYDLGGKLYVSHISFPPLMYDADALQVGLSSLAELAPRAPDGHKGDFGQALFIAGAAGYLGAPYFSAMSFLKAGGGYSRLAAPRSIAPFIAVRGGEIVLHPQAETAAGSIALQNRLDLLALAGQVDVVVLGPGLSLDPETQQLARELAAEIDRPLLVDGDGITAVAQDLAVVKGRGAETILTPHLGEMARLTGRSVREIDDDKIDTLQRTAAALNATVVLKGAHSLIGHPDGRVFVNTSGNSGMATAGSGDVLAGTIAAMFGLGLPLPAAARQGVFVHGLAGDLAAGERGEDGITAQDILDNLPAAMKAIRHGLDEAQRERYATARVI